MHFLTNEKWHFLAAKSGGDLEKSIKS